jgi:hypothetical protein
LTNQTVTKAADKAEGKLSLQEQTGRKVGQHRSQDVALVLAFLFM